MVDINRGAARAGARGLGPAIAALALGAALLLGLSGTAAMAEPPVVKLATVTSRAAEVNRVFFGKVVARETLDFAFQVSGQVVEFPVEEGSSVPRGALVAQMDLEPFELALQEAQARADQARRTLERYKKLVGASVAESNLEDAQTQVELAEIALRNARRALDNATLHAPFDAVVAARLMPNFSTVAAGTPVVRLHDMSDLRIEIDVPEILFQRAGRDPELTLIAEFPAAAGRYPLEIREFQAETAEIGQTYRITLGMPRPGDLTVLPGSSAKVSATMRTGGESIEIPTSAVVIGNDRATHVMVFTPTGAREGTVSATPVMIEPTDTGSVRVTEGLSDGQEIVAIGAGQLQDGATVRRFTGFGD
ncbi:MAG: efflux RND transporter periplasmic adaptor subunit [Rhodobacteraceae bacterium]|nr:MAG: efflux RND transporter periplasmic adaptor subunit [Paracoccaceae bacterium]